MHLPTDLVQDLRELQTSDLALDDRARLRCRIAQHYEQIGDYEAASEALSEFWRGVGARPNVEGLNEIEQAEVILRVGALTGWLGSANKIEGAQEAAKDLITQSLRLFRAQGRTNKTAEAKSDLALCYWRTGEYDEARVMLEEAFRDTEKGNIEQRLIVLIRQAIVERESKRLNQALRFHNEAKPLIEKIDNHLLIASFHFSFANTLNLLSLVEDREDYVDRALIESAAASFHYEQAGHERYQACVENNLGYLLGKAGRFTEAHEHLDRAQALWTKLKDKAHLAAVDESRATILLAEGRNVEAEKTARSAVRGFTGSDEQSSLAEALTTHGTALARLAHPDAARIAFEQAISTAEQVGDYERAGIAAITLIEEFGNNLSAAEVCELLDHAGSLLDKTEDTSTLRRLARSAFQGLFLAQAIATPPIWNNFSLRRAVKQFEARLIKAALADSNGSVTHASQLLGFKHHQSLVSLLGSRHNDLVPLRSPKRNRRKHLISHPKK